MILSAMRYRVRVHTPANTRRYLMGGKIMNKTDARQIVLNVWNGAEKDARYPEALKALGLSESRLRGLASAARQVTVRRNPRVVLIAAGNSR